MAYTTWLTNPNQDQRLTLFIGMPKSHIAAMRWSAGLYPTILTSNMMNTLTDKPGLFWVEDDPVFHTEFDVAKCVPKSTLNVIAIQQAIINTAKASDLITSNIIEVWDVGLGIYQYISDLVQVNFMYSAR